MVTHFLPAASTACMKKKRAGSTTSVSSPGPHTRERAALGADSGGAPQLTSPAQPSSKHGSNMVAHTHKNTHTHTHTRASTFTGASSSVRHSFCASLQQSRGRPWAPHAGGHTVQTAAAEGSRPPGPVQWKTPRNDASHPASTSTWHSGMCCWAFRVRMITLHYIDN